MKKQIEERFQRVWDRFTFIEELDRQRSAAQDMALVKAEASLKDYKVHSNEFREALSDQAERLMPREEYNTYHIALVEKVNSLDARVLQNTAMQTGRSSGISTVGYIFMCFIASLGPIISIAIALLHH